MKKQLVSIVAACALALSMAFVLVGCDNPLKQETYTPQSKEATVKTPVIGVEGTLRVGVNTNNPPLAGQASKIVGIDVDIAAAIADEWGLKLEIVDVGASPLSSLQKGTVDLVLGVNVTDKHDGLTLSDPYIKTGVALFALDPAAPEPDGTAKIAAQSTSMSAWTMSTKYGADCMINASDLKTAFESLKAGEAGYVAADALIGSYAAYAAGVDASIIAVVGTTGGYGAAMLSSNTELISQVNATLTKLNTSGIIKVIEQKWMGKAIDLATVKQIAASDEDKD